MTLHLVWREDVIFVKLMLAWMLDEAFCTDTIYTVSYFAITHRRLPANIFAPRTQYPSDFHLAGLLPESITGRSDWTELVSKKSDLLDNVTRTYSPRFLYGELRLHQIGFLYRFLPRYRLKHLFYSYIHGNATYQGFIRRNFAWLLIAFIYITVLLTAMQLGIKHQPAPGRCRLLPSSVWLHGVRFGVPPSGTGLWSCGLSRYNSLPCSSYVSSCPGCIGKSARK